MGLYSMRSFFFLFFFCSANNDFYRLGEHPMAVAAMYSFLLDRHQAADIDGTLTVNLLKVIYIVNLLVKEEKLRNIQSSYFPILQRWMKMSSRKQTLPNCCPDF